MCGPVAAGSGRSGGLRARQSRCYCVAVRQVRLLAAPAAYAEAEEPVSTLINDSGRPLRARQPAAAGGDAVRSAGAGDMGPAGRFGGGDRPDAPERGPWLAGRGAVGRLRPGVEQLLADPGTLAAAARLLLDLHFTPVWPR